MEELKNKFHKKTPNEFLRQNQRALGKVMRDLEREYNKMEKQQQKLKLDIKKAAKNGQMSAMKIMAKDLVRTRKFSNQLMTLKANIQGVSLKITTMKANTTMVESMKGVIKAMHAMNTKMRLPELQAIMNQFMKESEMMNMKEEVVGDALDEAMGGDEYESESDQIVKQVLDELGLETTNQLEGLPPSMGEALAGPSKKPSPVIEDGANIDNDLEARLESLRRK